MLEVRRRRDLGQEPLGTDDGGEFRLQDLERTIPHTGRIFPARTELFPAAIASQLRVSGRPAFGFAARV